MKGQQLTQQLMGLGSKLQQPETHTHQKYVVVTWKGQANALPQSPAAEESQHLLLPCQLQFTAAQLPGWGLCAAGARVMFVTANRDIVESVVR